MAKLVAALGIAHAPGATGWLDKCPVEEQEAIVKGYNTVAARLKESKPDVIIGIANDHLLNFPMESIPDFCVGIGDEWHGPAPFFKDWLNLPDYSIQGHRPMARALVRGAARKGINLAFSEELLFDDNWSVPLRFLVPQYDVKFIPIHMNPIMPPIPTTGDCLRLGRALAKIIASFPSEERVAIMGTGGLSHDPGGAGYFKVNEAFDRWFMHLLEEGDLDRINRELTTEKYLSGGDGGAAELLAWIVALGAASAVGVTKGESMFYVASTEMRCGMGGTFWDIPKWPK